MRRGASGLRTLALLLACGICVSGRAAVSDAFVDPRYAEADNVQLTRDRLRQEEAIVWFMTGLLDEEAEGPDSAFASFRKVLDRDPGFVELAIKVAHEHLRRGETAEAIGVLKDALKKKPSDVMLNLALSSIYLRQLKKSELALKYAKLALDASPKDYAVYEALWEIYQAQGQISKAEQTLQRATRVKSTDPRFWLHLGELYARTRVGRDGSLSENSLKQAAELFSKAADYAGEDAAALNRAADFFRLAGQPEKAAELYGKTIEVDPDFPEAREKLAVSLEQAGQPERAVGALEAIVSKSPLNLPAYDKLVELYMKVGSYERALTAMQQAAILAQRGPFGSADEAIRHAKIAELLLYLKQHERAIAHLKEGMQRYPQVLWFEQFHAVALREAKKHDEALAAFEALLAKPLPFERSTHADIYFEYGAAAEQAGKLEMAEELFRRSIDLDPSKASRSYNYIGYMWVDRGLKLDEAGELIRKAVALEPDNGAYVDSLGWYYFKKGRYREALEELLKASTLLPEPDPIVLDHIGDAYERLGQRAEALVYWRKALALDSQNKGLMEKVESAEKRTAKTPVTPQTQGSPARE